MTTTINHLDAIVENLRTGYTDLRDQYTPEQFLADVGADLGDGYTIVADDYARATFNLAEPGDDDTTYGVSVDPPDVWTFLNHDDEVEVRPARVRWASYGTGPTAIVAEKWGLMIQVAARYAAALDGLITDAGVNELRDALIARREAQAALNEARRERLRERVDTFRPYIGETIRVTWHSGERVSGVFTGTTDKGTDIRIRNRKSIAAYGIAERTSDYAFNHGTSGIERFEVKQDNGRYRVVFDNLEVIQ